MPSCSCAPAALVADYFRFFGGLLAFAFSALTGLAGLALAVTGADGFAAAGFGAGWGTDFCAAVGVGATGLEIGLAYAVA